MCVSLVCVLCSRRALTYVSRMSRRRKQRSLRRASIMTRTNRTASSRRTTRSAHCSRARSRRRRSRGRTRCFASTRFRVRLVAFAPLRVCYLNHIAMCCRKRRGLHHPLDCAHGEDWFPCGTASRERDADAVQAGHGRMREPRVCGGPGEGVTCGLVGC